MRSCFCASIFFWTFRYFVRCSQLEALPQFHAFQLLAVGLSSPATVALEPITDTTNATTSCPLSTTLAGKWTTCRTPSSATPLSKSSSDTWGPKSSASSSSRAPSTPWHLWLLSLRNNQTPNTSVEVSPNFDLSSCFNCFVSPFLFSQLCRWESLLQVERRHQSTRCLRKSWLLRGD